MIKKFKGYASKSAMKSAKWVRNKVYFNGEIDVLRIPTISKYSTKGDKVKFTVTIERP